MSNKKREIAESAAQPINKNDEQSFNQKIARLGGLSYCLATFDFDPLKAEADAIEASKVLGAESALEKMVVAQMLSIHYLQQTLVGVANASRNLNLKEMEYLNNTSIKLSNTFVQQVNLLSRLQGRGGQKITIERVDIHNGGQAVVGSTINGDGGVKK